MFQCFGWPNWCKTGFYNVPYFCIQTVTSPQFVVTIEDLTSEEGGEAKFTVKVKGEPTPEVMWFHENEPIKDDDIYKIMAGEQGEVILHLPEVFPEDAGVYTVKAVNEAGEVSCSAVLTVLQGQWSSKIISGFLSSTVVHIPTKVSECLRNKTQLI